MKRSIGITLLVVAVFFFFFAPASSQANSGNQYSLNSSSHRIATLGNNSGNPISTGPSEPGLSCFIWPPQLQNISLQNAVINNTCVKIQPGTYTLNTTLYLDQPGHILEGSGIDVTILQAANTDGYANWHDPVIDTGQGAGYSVTVSEFTVDANGSTPCFNCEPYGATFGIGKGGVLIDHMKITGARCGGVVNDSGANMVVQYSILTQNGYHNGIPNLQDSQCNTTPPSSGLYIVGSTSPAPSIHDNQIFNNNGMGMDDDSSFGGYLGYNTMYGNAGWAAVSLFRASNWTITNNTISQPNSPYAYHPDCNSGYSAHTAAIRLCGESNSGFRANNNIIEYNNISSPYFGILLTGATGYEPTNNQIIGNDPTGTNIGCSDALPYGGGNTWTGNNCIVDYGPHH